ncbi:unnamed protein product [Orchesella dallaii]|uniref:DOMON domain-containing protein n=1 Tax=Orchesella dallaii TaxID=48710 RepID=A0ABP1QQI8_9HEXA
MNSISILLFSIFLFTTTVLGRVVLQNDPYTIAVQEEPLDPQGDYLLSWNVDLAKGEVTFEVEAITTGYVGFGISPTGSMAGADIFIAGVNEDKTTYAFDMHGQPNQNGAPIPDAENNWQLLEATEDETKTHLKFSRLLNTCDDEDYPISNDTVRIIWSIGATDDLLQHATRGTKSLNLLMPNEEDFNPDEFQKWDFLSNLTMPKDDTTYWCTVHKAPELNETHHVIAFEAVLESQLAKDHTHHFILYKCITPEGSSADELFGEFVGQPGESCYLPSEQQTLPTEHCLGHFLFVWATGGRRMVFPEDVGYPIPDKVGENSYYMLEIHYDNPKLLENQTFVTGGRLLYTDNLRKIEAGLLTVAHSTHVTLTIPPNQENYIVAGQCGSECTDWGIPDENGIQVFNSLLHSHLSGQKIKLRHFRGEEELPWFDFDDHYDFNFQQSKPLIETKQILKKDHLTVECTYNNKWNNGSIVVGGLSTREEMCMAFLWYYPKLDFETCGSRYNTRKHFQELGVTNYTGEGGGVSKYTIVEPLELAGTYEGSMSTKFNWTEDIIREFERNHRYGVQDATCHGSINTMPTRPVQFPVDVYKYVPEDVCAREAEEPTTTPTITTTPGGGGGAGRSGMNAGFIFMCFGILSVMSFQS